MSLPAAAPEELGLDLRRLAIADAHTQAGVDDGTYPAAVLLVARHGKVAHHAAFGALQPGGKPTRPDSLFDLASVTKPCVATALLTLVEDGKVSLTQTVQEALPEAKNTAVGPLTLRLLATHTSGLPPWKPLYKLAEPSPPAPLPDSPLRGREKGGENKTRILAEILRTPLHHPPGTHYVYSDLGYLLLGEIVERASGMALDQYLHARLFVPLGMKETGYLPLRGLPSSESAGGATRRGRIAATANCPMRPGKTLVGEVHDANAHAFGGVAGHAGLFGTAPDLAVLVSALTGSGAAKGHRLLGLPTLRLARTNQTTPDVGGHSIGWFTPPNGMLPRGDLLGDTAFGHTGFTGTMVVCDPAYDLVIVLLTNRVMNPDDNGGIQRVRRRVVNAVASAVIQ